MAILQDSKFGQRLLYDPKFFLESLVEITTKERRVIPFIFNPPQNRYYEQRTNRDIILKPRQLGFCLHPNTRILTANLKWVSLREIQVSQKVVAVDEFCKDTRRKVLSSRKLRTAIVQRKNIIIKRAFRISMDDGRELIATEEHRFLSRERYCSIWKQVKDFKIGDEIRYITKPWEKRDLEDGWFDGIIDDDSMWAKIVKLEELETQEMIDLQTSEKTYIAEGFVSHNSTEIMGLFLHDTMFVPNTISVIIAHTTDDAATLFERVKFMFYSIPDIFKPHVKYSNRKELVFDKINSSYFIGSAEAKDFGRSKTINNLHLCVHPDVEVLLENGFAKKIKEVGIPTMRWSGDLIAIHVRMNPGRPIIVTPNHKILTQDGWKEAKDITKIDKIAQLRRTITGQLTYLTIPLLKKKCTQRHQYKEIKYGEINLALDKEFGWIIGMFLAKAAVRSKCVDLGYCLHIQEQDYANRIKNFFNKFDFCNASIYLNEKCHKMSVMVTSRTWTRFFRHNFYLNPNEGTEKYIPDWVFNTNKEFCDGLVKGYIDGDGTKTKDKVSGKRPQLIHQIRDLLCALGYGWSSVFGGLKTRPDSRFTTQKVECTSLGLAGNTLLRFLNKEKKETQTYHSYSRNHYGKTEFIQPKSGKKLRIDSSQNYEIDNNYIYQKILKIEKVFYSGQLYDMINQPQHRYRTISGVIHNSEAASPSFSVDLLTGLLEAVPRGGRIVMESTARGEGNLFHKYYVEAKDGVNEFRHHYYRWFELAEYQIPLFEGEEKNFHLTVEEEELKNKYGLSLAQIKWRREKKQRLGNSFVQEYPEDDDDDAFIKSGSPVFDTIWLNQRDKDLPEQYPAEIWLGGDLYIYKIVEAGGTYVVGADCSEGDINSDYSAALVLRVKPLPFEQVALLHGRWTPDIFSEKLWRIGRAYNNATIAVERNNHGHAVIQNLANGIMRRGEIKYPPYSAIYVGPDKKLGWLTTSLSKPQMLQELDRALRAEEIIINSKKFISEAKKFSFLKGSAMGASTGSHDDIVMAMAIALMAAISGVSFQFSFI